MIAGGHDLLIYLGFVLLVEENNTRKGEKG